MKKSIRILGLALLGVAALALPLSAHASCAAGAGGIFGSYYSQVTGTTNGPSLRSSFWMLDNGNPGVGPGIDNGGIAETGPWVHPYGSPVTIPIALLGKWDDLGYDNCPDTLTPNAAMAWAMSDVDGTGNMVYAVGCASRDGQAFTQWDFTTPPHCTSGCQPLALVPAPKAGIAGTVRSGIQAQITVGSPNFAPGFYGDGSPGCAMATVIPQYEVYKQEVTRNGAAPGSRDATTGWVSVGTGNIGTSLTFTTACASDCDVYVATLPAYNSGFKTGEPATGGANRVGSNSIKVQAGPILANPPKPRISNPKKTQ